MSRLASFIAGAAAVGLIVAVLALAGAFGGDTTVVRAQSTPTPAATTAPTGKLGNVSEVYARVSPGVVFVQANSGRGELPFPGGGRAASGSGFVIDRDGHVVTNDHVVEGATQYRIRFGESGDPIAAKLLGTDPSSDLALLKVDPDDVGEPLNPLMLGASEELQPGDPAIAIGSPFGLEGSVTTGIVSALGRTIQAPNNFSISDAVQTDAAINPGNSGGPLLDAEGRVIGVNSQGRGGASGIAFAVPVDTLERVLPQLRKGRKVERPFLGVSTAGDGRRVADVVRGGAAQKAGVREGDVIVSVDGRAARGAGDVAEAVRRRKPGDRVVVVVRRGDRELTLRATLGSR
jgi:S1-C subfamily serine protease